jgi:hypothetical protein
MQIARMVLPPSNSQRHDLQCYREISVRHSENRVPIIEHTVLIFTAEAGKTAGISLACRCIAVLVEGRRNGRKTGFVQLVSAVVGWSFGVGVMTATVLLGVAALLQ